MLARIRKAMEEREGGFTLIELLVVMIIIGILAAIAIPVFLNQRNNAYDTATKSDLHNAATAEESYFVDNATYTNTTAGLATEGWKNSKNDTAQAFTMGGTAPNYTSYAMTFTSQSGKFWCYDSAASGNGITSVATAASTC
jgi:type IV pilus assembly protein PilA